jgi:hypothetical protein
VLRFFRMSLMVGTPLALLLILLVNTLEPSRAVTIGAFCAYVVVALLISAYLDEREHGGNRHHSAPSA